MKVQIIEGKLTFFLILYYLVCYYDTNNIIAGVIVTIFVIIAVMNPIIYPIKTFNIFPIYHLLCYFINSIRLVLPYNYNLKHIKTLAKIEVNLYFIICIFCVTRKNYIHGRIIIYNHIAHSKLNIPWHTIFIIRGYNF